MVCFFYFFRGLQLRFRLHFSQFKWHTWYDKKALKPQFLAPNSTTGYGVFTFYRKLYKILPLSEKPCSFGPKPFLNNAHWKPSESTGTA